ncbi:MAG: CSLREA domain-containing protein, partial [Acidobacteria bacterium]|nr:CSLREA domain-containing protein [Acidobacteriota bacterium]
MRKHFRIFPVVATIFLIAVAATSALAITVTITLDNGNFICVSAKPCPPQCTLRDAIDAANYDRPVNGCAAGPTGFDNIVFNVGYGTPTIRLLSELPPITKPVEINGGTGGATRIEITLGSIFNPLGRRIDGLILATGDSTIRNLVINGFSGNGIVMTSISGGYLQDHTPPMITDPSIPTNPPCDMRPTDPNCFPRGPGGGGEDRDPDGGAGARNKIFGCFIIGNGSGINASGTAYNAGIVTETDLHIIGGPTPEEQNVISGNRGHGLVLGGKGHVVRGNFIGVDGNGACLSNLFDGIIIAGGQFFGGIGTIGASQQSSDGKCQIVIDSTGRVLDARKDCGNRIAFNGRYGINMGFNGYEILSNTIFSNGDLGLDVDSVGVTPNDPAGSLRNYPEWRFSMSAITWNPPALGTRVIGSITNWRSGPSII